VGAPTPRWHTSRWPVPARVLPARSAVCRSWSRDTAEGVRSRTSPTRSAGPWSTRTGARRRRRSCTRSRSRWSECTVAVTVSTVEKALGRGRGRTHGRGARDRAAGATRWCSRCWRSWTSASSAPRPPGSATRRRTSLSRRRRRRSDGQPACLPPGSSAPVISPHTPSYRTLLVLSGCLSLLGWVLARRGRMRPFLAAVLAEIYLCGLCFLSRNIEAQRRPLGTRARAAAGGLELTLVHLRTLAHLCRIARSEQKERGVGERARG
jgi:hypothetical protein